MKQLLQFVVLMTGFFLVSIQVSAQQSIPLVIIDVKVSFQTEPSGYQTYFRVYDNGDVEFDDYKSTIKGFYHYRTHISSEQVKTLLEMLRSTEVIALKAKYSFGGPLKRLATQVKITIPNSRGAQEIEVEDDGDKSIPNSEVDKGLAQLFCAIETFRKPGIFRIIDTKACAP